MYLIQMILYTRYSMNAVSYRCYFTKEEVTEGESIDLIEEIENHSALSLPWIRSEYSVSKYLEFADTHSVVTDKTRFVSSLFYLRSYSRVQRTWHVCCLKRGEYQTPKVMLVTSDLFGTVKASKVTEQTQQILTVLPKCFANPDFRFPIRSITEGEMPVRYSPMKDPFMVSTILEYTGYEPLRRMDWNASAKLGKLMTRTEESTQNQETCICFTAQTAEYGRRFISEEISEHTIRVCAALFREYTLLQQPFSVQSNCTSHGEMLTAPVSCSAGNYLMLLRGLAALDTEPDLSLRQSITIPPHARVIFIVPYLSEDIRRLKEQYPDCRIILTAPPNQGNLEFIPVYQEEFSCED